MSSVSWRTAIVAVTMLTAVSCTDAHEPGGNPTNSPSVSVASSPGVRCPNEEAAIATPRSESKGHLRGDVDGDGEKDDVFLIYGRSGRPGCQAFLIVDTKEQTRSTPIADWGDDAFVPRLAFLKEIDGRAGREVVVTLGVGASTELFGLFTWDESAPRRIDIRGWFHSGDFPIHDASADDLIAQGASTGHAEAVACTQDDLLLVSAAFPKSGGAGSDPYVVERRFFRPISGGLVLSRHEVAERPFDAYAKDFFEFRSPPFAHCNVAKDRTAAERWDRKTFAIWPADTYSEGKALCRRTEKSESWRSDYEGFAKEFAAGVLGWPSASIGKAGAATGTWYATVRREAGSAARVVLGVVDVVATGPLTDLRDEDTKSCLMLQVLEPPPPGDGAPLDVKVRGRKLVAKFKTHGASSAEVIVGYGTHDDVEKTVTSDRVVLRLPFSPDSAGHVLVLLRDEDGIVFSAFGHSLKAGNFSYRYL